MNYRGGKTLCHLTGWVLFLICAFLFLYAAVRDGDTILALASLVFLGGCIAFLIPLLFPAPATGRGIKDKGSETSAGTG